MSEPKKKLTLKRKTGAVDAASPARNVAETKIQATVKEAAKRDEPLNGLQKARFIVGSPGGRDIIIANQQYLPPERHEEQPPLTARSNIILAQKGDGPARGN